MKILLSGATGFLGSHLLLGFINNNYKVVILKRATSNLKRIKEFSNSFTSYNIDEDNIETIFEKEKPEIVVHTACSYGRKGESIASILNTNLIFGIKLLEASLANNVKTFINSGSLLPRNINNYSLSKAQFSDWLQKKSDLINVINFKIEHMFGPKDDENKFLGWLIKRMLSGNDKIDLTNGTQKRDFIYIDDIVNAFNLVIEKNEELEGWNEFDLGTGIFIDVKTFVENIAQQIEQEKGIQVLDRLNFGAIPYRKGEIMTPNLDNSKLVALGWTPETPINKGIQETLKNYT